MNLRIFFLKLFDNLPNSKYNEKQVKKLRLKKLRLKNGGELDEHQRVKVKKNSSE
jgi:hypothetical protein